MVKRDAEKGARVMEATEFQAHCLELMEEAAECGEPLIITKNGKLLAILKPSSPQMRELFGHLKDRAEIQYDLDKPIYEQWLAEQGKQGTA